VARGIVLPPPKLCPQKKKKTSPCLPTEKGSITRANITTTAYIGSMKLAKPISHMEQKQQPRRPFSGLPA